MGAGVIWGLRGCTPAEAEWGSTCATAPVLILKRARARVGMLTRIVNGWVVMGYGVEDK